MSSGNTRKLGSGTPYWLKQDDEGRLLTVGTPEVQANEVLADSDKTLTVPADTWWKIKSIWLELTTDATVGNRQLQIDIRDDAADVIFQMRVGIVQAASITRYYALAPHSVDLTAFRDTDYLMTPFPELTLAESWSIRIFDNAVVAVAGDNLIVQVITETRTVLEP